MKKHIAILAVVAILLKASSFLASAQTNVVTETNFVTVTVTNVITVTNTVPPPPVVVTPATLWESSAGLGFTLTRGNSDTLLFTANIQTHRKTVENELTLGADGAYGENNSVANVNDIHGFGQYNHLFTDRFFGYVRGDALHDEIADLQYRVTIGPGVGYYVIKETNTSLAFELGPSFVNQRLGGEGENYVTLRVAERFEHKFKHYGARVWESVEFLPQVDKVENYLMNSEIGIEAAVSKKMSLKTFLDDNFASEPAAGRQKNDVRLVTGISYKF
jgi:putative salt-induced outer membrane protein YdiY